MKRINRILIVCIAISLAAPQLAGAAGTRLVSNARNPILALPASVRNTFSCIMWRESRSTFVHLNLGDNNRYGSSGIFQIMQGTWQAHQLAAHVPLSVHVWQASPLQQEEVAIAIWRADGFAPWGRYDGC